MPAVLFLCLKMPDNRAGRLPEDSRARTCGHGSGACAPFPDEGRAGNRGRGIRDFYSA